MKAVNEINQTEQNFAPEYDNIIEKISEYVLNTDISSELAYNTARLCVMDTMGCGILALKFPECKKLLGPIVPLATLSQGVPVPGTEYELDPVEAAFNIGTMNRWLDFNDTWLAKEWGHPSDNLAAILAVTDYLGRVNHKTYTMQDVLTALIKAYEIQGIFALENSFNKVGLDHVILVKLASTAVATHLLGGDGNALKRALSQVFVDGQSLRVYRHAPNAGSRKSWAAGDAAARGVRLALLTLKGEMGYPSAISVPTWGFADVSFKGRPFVFNREFDSYVMENILFKVSYPAEFHAQTAVECAVKLHPTVKDKIGQIEKIELETHESAIRIISKSGPLHNPADRDHCLQYMVAIGLLEGDLTAEHYENEFAHATPQIDILRDKIIVKENKDFSQDYLDPEKRSISNSIQVFFTDGTSSEKVTVHFPIGHKFRREESISLLREKFTNNISWLYSQDKVNEFVNLFENSDKFAAMPVIEFMNLWRQK